MKVNGKAVKLEEPVSLAEFLEADKYNLFRIAVELNGSVVPKEAYRTVILSPGDILEIVNFVGGG